MLFFNYQNLYFMASSDCKRIVRLLLLHNKVPIKQLVGTSYIRNLDPILSENYSWQDKAEYIGILSYRHHPEEMFYRTHHLNLDDLPPWIPREVILKNPLITVINNQVTFPFENKD